MKYYYIGLLFLIVVFALELLLLCVYYVASNNVNPRNVAFCSQDFAQSLTNWDFVSGILIIMMQGQFLGAICIHCFYTLKKRHDKKEMIE